INSNREAMVNDLRVKAVVRPRRQGEASGREVVVDSDEEWLDSSAESSGTGSSTSKQRRSDDSDCRQTTQSREQPVVMAPPPEKTEASAFAQNNKVEARNKKLQNSRSTKLLVPDEWVHYSKTFVCTHAGKYKPRGQGKRKRQDSRALDCDVQINTCVQVADSAAAVPTFVLRITAARLEHNHSLSRHTFDHYPHNRTSFEPEMARNVTELVKAGTKKKRILQFIHENSNCNPTSQDIHNLVRKLKKQAHTAQTSAKRLKQWMAEFTQEPGNVGGVFVDSVHDKTKCMREMFDRFPEVVMIDATHGTNLSKYKVFSIMAHDAFGKGQFVQHAVIQNERNPTLLTALEQFKRNNPAWGRIKCILIDKDFGEIGVLKRAFPEATLLLC
uniref:ZSWIM1/3 RNaseH-like domain-containing protein n=1 Tax=Phytophthora ramorum TaxID=164328 RepID=H3GK04_PHYRM